MLYAPGEGPALDMVREHMVEIIMMHLVFECIFYGFLNKRINPKGAEPMGWDMWVHHIGSIAGAAYCKVVSNALY
eukprot:8643250-Pyramimonas_sp.AAC.1